MNKAAINCLNIIFIWINALFICLLLKPIRANTTPPHTHTHTHTHERWYWIIRTEWLNIISWKQAWLIHRYHRYQRCNWYCSCVNGGAVLTRVLVCVVMCHGAASNRAVIAINNVSFHRVSMIDSIDVYRHKGRIHDAIQIFAVADGSRFPLVWLQPPFRRFGLIYLNVSSGEVSVLLCPLCVCACVCVCVCVERARPQSDSTRICNIFNWQSSINQKV